MSDVRREDCRISSYSAGKWVDVLHYPSGVSVRNEETDSKEENTRRALAEIARRLSRA